MWAAERSATCILLGDLGVLGVSILSTALASFGSIHADRRLNLHTCGGQLAVPGGFKA